MLGVILSLILVTLIIVSGETTSLERSLGDATILEENFQENSQLDRQGKFFPLFSVVRFANNECAGSSGLTGTCFTKRECSSFGGTAYGTCASSLGVCCVFRKSCGTTSKTNNTYLVNPGYPLPYKGGPRCTLDVYRCDANICQLRIDFLDFSIAQPNSTGVCDYDFLRITGGSTQVPKICGDDSNQHVYVEFDGANPIMISIVTNSEFAMNRRWNLRIQQIACDSPWRAPNGCLQYYTEVSDTVSSFNYGQVPNPRVSATVGTIGTRQMQYLNYGVCVRMAVGYCSIEWSQADSLSFTISGDTGVLDPTTGAASAMCGTICDHNFVIIPNPSATAMCVNVDRFCGNGFETITSSSKPFVMWVVTNPEATGVTNDFENRGFLLKYRQLPCNFE